MGSDSPRTAKLYRQVRLVGKRMKAWNRRVYYVFKWSLYAAIALAIFWRDVSALPGLIARVL